MKVLVCGGRNFNNKELLTRVMNDLDEKFSISLIISGHARGADQLSEEWAHEFGIPVDIYPADWNRYGKSAGFIRNKYMIEKADPQLVVAFPGGKGTANMINLANEYGVPVYDVSIMIEEDDKNNS